MFRYSFQTALMEEQVNAEVSTMFNEFGYAKTKLVTESIDVDYKPAGIILKVCKNNFNYVLPGHPFVFSCYYFNAIEITPTIIIFPLLRRV
jgi:hypothetical protein